MASSGSPVFNADTLKVEGLVFNGNLDFVQDGGCDRSQVCPDATGCPLWEDVVRTTEFEELVPSADVYFGTDPCQIMLLSEDLSAPLCEPGPLDCGTIYYWRVVKKNICGEQWGPIWSFRTYPTGDFDQDCTVDLEDFARLAEVWMAGSCEAGNGWCSGGDLSQNGQVDPSDLERFLRHWLEASQP